MKKKANCHETSGSHRRSHIVTYWKIASCSCRSRATRVACQAAEAAAGRECSSKAGLWKADSLTWRKELRVTATCDPYTSIVPASKLPSSKRARDLLDCIAMQQMRTKRARVGSSISERDVAEHLSHVVADLSQSHKRRPFNRGPVVRTLTTSSSLWTFAQQRFLTAREHLLLQGYSQATVLPAQMKETDLRHIAGEGISLPPLALVVWSIFLSGKLC